MSLFFYGAVELKNDEIEVTKYLLHLTKELNWNLKLNELLREFSISELFGLPKVCQRSFLVFELQDRENDDVYTELYNDYGGEQMVYHYRKIAREIGVSNYDVLEFGSQEKVNQAYQEHPFDLSVVRFSRSIFEHFFDRDIVICFDEGFENRFECKELIGGSKELLREVWLTIAFGYSWPNLRLWFKSNRSNSIISKYSKIKTLTNVQAEFSNRLIPDGTIGTIVECYSNPESYAVDLEIPAPELVGGYTYENVVLMPSQFEIIENK